MFEMSANDLDLDYLSSSRHFHLSSLFLHKSLQADLPGIFRELKSAGLTLSLDTNDDPEDRWQGPLEELLDLTDILLPNEQEACRIARTPDPKEAVDLLAARVPIVAVKLGSRGALVRSGQQEWRIPPIAVTPVDTIGAGDSFNAGFLSAFVRGKAPEECAALGNRAAALSTLRPGGTEAFRDAQLLRQFMEGAENLSSRI
jgi:sugar/nucleoside kinase (ribokinase family)